MIKSFKHKGLSSFFATGSLGRINAQHASRLARILDRLDASRSPQDMNLTGYKMHQLSGDKKGFWSISVSGNWRVTFQFDKADVINVDYCDYH